MYAVNLTSIGITDEMSAAQDVEILWMLGCLPQCFAASFQPWPKKELDVPAATPCSLSVAFNLLGCLMISVVLSSS